MQEIKSHYDGTSEESRRKQFDISDLNNIFYNNETTFTFEKYITKTNMFFNVLENMVSHSTRSRLSSIY